MQQVEKKTFPTVTSLLPHRPPMLLVDEVLSVEPVIGTARACIGPNHLFLRQDGTVSPEVFCELVAQGFGVCEACRRLEKGLTLDGGGYLASLRDVEIFASAKTGDTLTVKTERLDECFGTYIVKGEVFSNEQKLAQATVYIFMWQGKTPETK